MNRKVSIITPWKGHPELIPDYESAVQGAEVITVDNTGEANEDSEILKLTMRHNGVYIKNPVPVGFALSNNLGLREASGDIIVFLNNDIYAEPSWLEIVRSEVQEDALYGPAIAQQCLYGCSISYLEGWCVAGTRRVWESLNGWDAQNFRDFYWEDVDLSFRAVSRGYQLIRTNWPIFHKGNRTIISPQLYGRIYERNRAIFASRVQKSWNLFFKKRVTSAQQRFIQALNTKSDIQHHLPLIYTISRGNVLDLGVRSGNSTTAMIAGVEMHGGHVWSVDKDPRCERVFAGHPQWTFICSNSVDPFLANQVPNGFNLILLDTEHTYAQVKAELEMWAKCVRPFGIICVHDTETFQDARKAVEDYCSKLNWIPYFLKKSNGMGVIEVPSKNHSEKGGKRTIMN